MAPATISDKMILPSEAFLTLVTFVTFLSSVNFFFLAYRFHGTILIGITLVRGRVL